MRSSGMSFTNIIDSFRNQDNFNKYSLNDFTLHAQGKIEIDYKQQNAYAHLPTRGYQYESSFQEMKTLCGTSTTVISELSNDDNDCSSYYLPHPSVMDSVFHPILVLLPGIETTFLPVRIQKFIYSRKTKTKTNQLTNIEARGIYHDNICGIGQEGTYSLDLWMFPMDNKIEEPVFTFESIINQQVQEQIITWYSTQLRLIQLFERFLRLKLFLIILNKYGLHLKDILNEEKNGLDIFLEDEDIGQIFQQVKSLISVIITQQILYSICQYLQLQYEQTKDKNSSSFEKYRLRIFWLNDNDCLLINLHYADSGSDSTQLVNAQQTFTTHINNQTKIHLSFMMKQLIYMILQGNQYLTNSLINLRRLLVPNGLLLLLELIHILLYFDLIFSFIDQ
ncbi:unnamed protein product [Adineta steineri]|uniref:PKS/mFAS DH domain-containing protein n=1 Tax=Adineta steineri TaxID=433720 RepID=A0A819KVK2_9BILA|nr:unnamed protein product [Adineta steineri]